MAHRIVIAGLAACTLLACSVAAQAQVTLNLASPLLTQGEQMPRSAVANFYGCNGENMSPPLSWSGAPKGTKSFAVTMYDPDVEGGRLHWALMNIPADMISLPADAGRDETGVLPTIVQRLPTSFDGKAYAGACPPLGETHHYEFTVYAMRDAMPFYPHTQTGRPTVEWLRDHSLAKATMTIPYKR